MLIQEPIYFYNADLAGLNDIPLDNIDRRNFSTYNFNGMPVPRVSDILKITCDSSSLVNLASTTGKKFNTIMDNAATVGTLAHEKMENYLQFDVATRPNWTTAVPFNLAIKVDNAFTGFKAWLEYLEKRNIKYKVYAVEKPIITPWFGGTTDCIIGLIKNGIETRYVLDFKTSNSIIPNYYLQTYTYFWGLMFDKYCLGDYSIPDIDGVAILRVDKNYRRKFEFKTIEFNSEECKADTLSLHNGFMSMMHWFYSYIRL